MKCHLLQFVALSITGIAVGCDISSPTVEEIDQDTLRTIDNNILEPALKRFIRLAQQNKTIGRSAAEFNDVLELAEPQDEDTENKRIRWYSFVLPMTAEAQTAFEDSQETPGKVLYWPMMAIRVDTESNTITRVVVFTQGL